MSPSSLAFYFWFLLLGFPVLLAIGLFGAVYYIAFPELPISGISTSASTPPPSSIMPAVSQPSQLQSSTTSHLEEPADRQENRRETDSSNTSWSTLIRTSSTEERKVLEVLASHNGRYLQKQIVKESGLNKLKTHRIIARFAKRGIVNVRRQGNTNEIAIADWLRISETNSEHKY